MRFLWIKSRATSCPASGRASVAASLVLHGAVLAALLWVGAAATKARVLRPVQPVAVGIETTGGTHAVKIMLPEMNYAAHTKEPVKHADSAVKTILPVPKQVVKKSGGGAPAVAHAGDGMGVKFGNGTDANDEKPAYPVFSPRPPVTDRAMLPKVEQKIVVDVNVDELGAVVSEVLVKGMGNQLDQIVLETVKTWRFQPALVNGKAVPTQAELIFPFGPEYPITVG
jgi:TonB family protein